VARGGQMLAPGTPADPIQFIDVSDLAEFVTRCVERREPGRFNVCNPPRAVTMGMLLDVSKRVTHSGATFKWASVRFLEAQHLIGPEAADSVELPIWAAPSGEDAGSALVSPARAIAKGLRFRSLEQTVRDTLEWQKARPAAQQTLHAGLKPEREAELLSRL
jgi:2'-hydroxyisoflavone reductase